MEENIRPFVVGVRFSKVGKVYHFSASNVADVKVGDRVVVETSRGWQLGQVAQVLDDIEIPPEGWKSIDRRATPRDLLLRQMWQMKESEVVEACRTRVNELRLNGVKVVSAEYSFDGARLTILFSTETEEKYDLKSLRQDMQKLYAPSQVELRQVGPRDVAKVHCGMGACGLETRCCCLFLTEFSSISIRMAKEQGISLTPSEITGMCGRLRCCLIYEYDNYVEARTKLPKRNKHVRTPQGEGKVVDIVPLRNAVIVEIPEIGHKEFPAEEVVILDESSPQQAETQDRSLRQPGASLPSIVEPSSKPLIDNKPEVEGDETKVNRSFGRERGSPDSKQRFHRRHDQDRREATPNAPNLPGSGSDLPSKKESNSQEVKSSRPASKWRKPDRKPNPKQSGNQTVQPRNSPEGKNQPRNNKDNRRKRGNRRDNNDNQN